MPAPLVISKPENMGTATGYAEKANHISENKCKIKIGVLDAKQNESLNKMTKEMNDLKYELSQLKPQCTKRIGKKEAGRNSPKAKLSKRDVREVTNENEENDEPKRRGKLGDSMAERSEHERITNMHRRYSAQLGADVVADVQKLAKKNKQR